MEKKPEDFDIDLEQEDNSLLGPHKSSSELKAEEKEIKALEKENRKLERKTVRETRKDMPKEPNVVMWVVVGILAFVILLVGVFIAIDWMSSRKDMDPDSGHFTRLDDEPEMSAEGIKGVITEAYYTNDKHLALKLKFSNAYNTKQYLTSLEVKVNNADGKVIATGFTDKIENYAIPAEGYNTFTFYISPEYVKIGNDSLENLTYEITTHGSLEDKDATARPDTTASGAEDTTTAAE